MTTRWMKLISASVALLIVTACTTSTKPPDISYDLSGDVLFGLNEYKLTKIGERAISDLAWDIKQTQFQTTEIRIFGHTDKLGTPEYNLKLSQARADTIKTQLLKLNLPHEIMAVGVGDTEPVVFCPDKSGDELIKCLAPNRRVHIRLE